MNIEMTLKKLLEGSIRLFLHSLSGEKEIGVAHNLILNTGMELLARSMAGTHRVNGMYFLFDNDGPGTYPEFTADTALSHFHTTLSTGYLGFIRAPLVADSVVTAAGAAANASYTSISGRQVAVDSGSNELTDGVSMFYGAALGYLHPTDITKDILLSAVRFSDVTSLDDGVILKTPGLSPGIRWNIQAQNQ